jgi:hypothetical protein
MRKFRVFIRGEHFLLNLDGERRKVGFYTTRFVEAPDEREAELAAIEILRNDPQLVKGVLNERSDPPMMYAEEITELADLEGCPVPGTGFAFFTEDEEHA